MGPERIKEFSVMDLQSFFPKQVAAFFLVSRTGRPGSAEIAGFLKEVGSLPSAIHSPRQIHSAEIIEECGRAECDGVFTKRTGEAVSVAAADCVPMLISANEGRAVMALHAGWKGTLGKIAEKAGRHLDPKDFDRVWIGPSIRGCCYKVNEERISAFKELFGEMRGIDEKNGTLDLPTINAEIFLRMCVPKEKIVIDGRCSSCSQEGFASYRRDGDKAGRMIAVGMLLDL